MKTPELGDDFRTALSRAGLLEFFEECTASHRREYLHWIGEAKRPETRARRIQEAVVRLKKKCADERQKPAARK